MRVKRFYVRLISFCLLCVACLFVFCSCLGPTSLEKYGYVLTLGIDEGKVYKYNVSFLLESEITDSQQNNTSKTNIIAAEGDNIFEAIYTAEAGLPFRLNFSRMNYTVVSFEIAKKDKIVEFFSASWANLKIRTSSNIIISQDTAYSFINGLNYASGINVTKLENSLIDFYYNEGLTAITSITEFMSASQSERFDAVVPLGATDTSVKDEKNKSDTTGGVYRTGGMTSYTLGAALFSNSKLCGTISGKEVQILLLMQGELKGANTQFTRKDGSTYTVLIGNSGPVKRNITIDKNGRISAQIVISMSVSLKQDSSFYEKDKVRKYDTFTKEMKEQISNYIITSCRMLTNNFKMLGCDSLGIGKYTSMKFSTVKEWESFDFRSHIKDIEYSFKTEFENEDILASTYME